jgi:hypothetical protein
MGLDMKYTAHKPNIYINLSTDSKIPSLYVNDEQAGIVSCRYEYHSRGDRDAGKNVYHVTFYLRSDEVPTLHELHIDQVTNQMWIE